MLKSLHYLVARGSCMHKYKYRIDASSSSDTIRLTPYHPTWQEIVIFLWQTLEASKAIHVCLTVWVNLDNGNFRLYKKKTLAISKQVEQLSLSIFSGSLTRVGDMKVQSYFTCWYESGWMTAPLTSKKWFGVMECKSSTCRDQVVKLKGFQKHGMLTKIYERYRWQWELQHIV
jgi:hypothetical protein